MTDRLSIYNGALLVLKQRRLASLTEDLDYRIDLDLVWDQGGVETCLEAANWNFATRTRQLDNDPAITPAFGYSKAFGKPTDFVRLVSLSAEGMFREPYLNYFDEGAYWYSDITPIFVRHVSKDATYGLDFSKWPYRFTRYVESYFGWRIAGRVSGQDPDEVEGTMNRRLKEAKGTDAQNEATVFPPRGFWSRARGRGGQGRIEQGN